MFFSHVVAALFTFGAASVAASPAPAIAKRADISNVIAIVSNLQSTTSTILPQIDALTKSSSVSESSLSPLLTQLIGALNGASTSLDAFNSVQQTDGTKQDVANAVAPVVSNIATSINGFQQAHPSFSPFIAGFEIDVALNRLLKDVERLVAGVLRILSGLLVGVAGLLDGVAFGLTGGLLGLL